MYQKSAKEKSQIGVFSPPFQKYPYWVADVDGIAFSFLAPFGETWLSSVPPPDGREVKQELARESSLRSCVKR
jgi:hypothetical protein